MQDGRCEGGVFASVDDDACDQHIADDAGHVQEVTRLRGHEGTEEGDCPLSRPLEVRIRACAGVLSQDFGGVMDPAVWAERAPRVCCPSQSITNSKPIHGCAPPRVLDMDKLHTNAR